MVFLSKKLNENTYEFMGYAVSNELFKALDFDIEEMFVGFPVKSLSSEYIYTEAIENKIKSCIRTSIKNYYNASDVKYNINKEDVINYSFETTKNAAAGLFQKILLRRHRVVRLTGRHAMWPGLLWRRSRFVRFRLAL